MIDHAVSLFIVAVLITPVVIKCETENERKSGSQVEEKKNWQVQSDHNTGNGVLNLPLETLDLEKAGNA
jgi:hypothetical protein